LACGQIPYFFAFHYYLLLKEVLQKLNEFLQHFFI